MLTPMTKQCPACGAVCYCVKSTCGRELLVDIDKVHIYPNGVGDDTGYTFDGRFVRGWISAEPAYYGMVKMYECHREHSCSAKLSLQTYPEGA